MSQNTKDIMRSLMSSIDDIRDKINDGEYLNLCNLLKSLNDNINNVSQVEINNNDDDNDNNNDIINDLINDYNNDNRINIQDAINSFVEDYIDETDDEEDIKRKFNEFLTGYANDYEEEELPHAWFICRCGCSVCTNDIIDHIDTDRHIYNLRF